MPFSEGPAVSLKGGGALGHPVFMIMFEKALFLHIPLMKRKCRVRFD